MCLREISVENYFVKYEANINETLIKEQNSVFNLITPQSDNKSTVPLLENFLLLLLLLFKLSLN